MTGTRAVGNGFNTTDGGLILQNDLVYGDRTPISIVTGTTAYAVGTITASAKCTRILFEMPVLSGAVVTGVISIENPDGVVIYQSSVCAEDDTHIIVPDPAVPIVGTNTITLVLSTDPLSSGTGYLTTYLEGNKRSM
jgi:hypothetical protein